MEKNKNKKKKRKNDKGTSVLCGDISIIICFNKTAIRMESTISLEILLLQTWYIVLHCGVPVTLVPLDATRTIPQYETSFKAFEQKQEKYEAQYSFQSSKMEFSMWDPFMVGVALSQMRSLEKDHRENEFAKLEYMNLAVITSNKPYGISDGSNPLTIGGRSIPNFGLQKNRVMGIEYPFCLFIEGKGKFHETTGAEAVSVFIATEAKHDHDSNSTRAKDFTTVSWML
ncbi:hypothetical protein TB2_032971 [Malus domestica]